MAKLHDLPPELIAMFTANLDFSSHMSLMLASKALFSVVREVRPTQRQEWIDFNLNFEQHVPPRRALTLLTCTVCAELHPRESFSDSQRKKTNETRFCIKAGIRKETYSGQRTFRVGGVVMFGCERCCEAWPLAEQALYDTGVRLKLRFCKGCRRFASAHLAGAAILLLTHLMRVLTYCRQF